MKNNNDILIVGAGPVGLTLACFLAKYGLKVNIIDKRVEALSIPKAINISHSTLRIFEKLSGDCDFLSRGMKLSELTVYWEKKRLININYKSSKDKYPYFYHLEQIYVEKYLNNLLKKYECGVNRGITLVDLQNKDNQVDVITRSKDGSYHNDTYKYVIGCDGGNSAVREQLNISCEMKDYSAYFILVDAVVTSKLISKIYYYVNKDGYLIIAPLSENKFRFIFSFPGAYPGHDNIQINITRIQHLINERALEDITLSEILWSTSARFYHKLAEQAQKENVFLAGDALHQFSPVGGTNMNHGIQDAYSLAQKLILINKYECDASLLNLYHSERMHAVKINLHNTEIITALLTRIAKLSDKEKQFLPTMKNRCFIKHGLPNLITSNTPI